MTPQDHVVCASFYRTRAMRHVKRIIQIARDLNDNGWQYDADQTEAARDEMDFQRWSAARDFKQAIADEQAAVRRAA